MRIIPILVLSLALVMAGCAKKDDGGTATSTPPTGSSTTTTKTTTSTTATTTPTGTTTPTNSTTPTTPTKPAPQDITATADWTTNPGPPPGPPAAKAITIPAGYTMGNLTVKWDCSGAPVCVSSGVSVKVAGITCALADGATTPVADCVKEGAVTPGEAKFEYAGTGVVKATITLHLT